MSYNKRMQEEIARRDAALLRMKMAGNQTTTLIGAKIETAKAGFNQKLDTIKSKVSPENIIREHPWGAVLSALGAGLLAVPLLRSYFKPPKPPQREQTHIVSATPNQRIVVEVVGAKPQGGGHGSWKPLIDAMLLGLPAA